MKTIYDFLCDIGENPIPFVAGTITTTIGYILGILFLRILMGK